MHGALAGELMGHLVAEGGRVVVFIGMHATVDHEQKVEGFRNSFQRFCHMERLLA
jgi:ABC-type sugar transport system substrate-binding protein